MPGVARSDGGVCGLHPHQNVGPVSSSTLWMSCTNCQKRTLIWEACYCLDEIHSLCPLCAPQVSCSHCYKSLHLDVYHHCSSCIGNVNICLNCFTVGIRCAHIRKNNGASSSAQGTGFALMAWNKGLAESLPKLNNDREFVSAEPRGKKEETSWEQLQESASVVDLDEYHRKARERRRIEPKSHPETKPGKPKNQPRDSKPPQKPLYPNLPEGQPDSLEIKGKGKDADTITLDERLDGSIVTEKPNVSWNDVAGLQAAKDELQEAIIFPMRFPELFTGKRKPRQGILFYGPPGTGKSYLAKAVATEVDCTMFSISSSDIFSKWVGESEKLVKLLFEKARKHKPAIIFIDEVEALCGKRGADSNEASDRVKTEFLVQMDGVGNNTSGITIIGATNLPWQLDTAILRRFQRRIHIGLPDHEARVKAFQIHAGGMTSNITIDEFKELATLSGGFSGSDISNAVQDALMIPVRKIHSATHYRKVTVASGKDKSTIVRKWMPCAPTHPGAKAMTWREVSKGQLMEPPVEAADFYTVLKSFKSSVSKEDVKKAIEWTNEYGIEGA